jgi:Ca2+-binding EF-hand superfamily protein
VIEDSSQILNPIGQWFRADCPDRRLLIRSYQMKSFAMLLIAFSFVLTVPSAFGEDSPKEPPKKVRSKEELFKARDKDGDGKVTLEEFLRDKKDQAKSKKRFYKLDKNKDDSLDLEEFKATK